MLCGIRSSEATNHLLLRVSVHYQYRASKRLFPWSDFSRALPQIFPCRVHCFFIMIHKHLERNGTHTSAIIPCYVFLFWGCSCLFTLRFPGGIHWFLPTSFLHVHDLTASFFLHNCCSIHLIQPLFFYFLFSFSPAQTDKKISIEQASHRKFIFSWPHSFPLQCSLFICCSCYVSLLVCAAVCARVCVYVRVRVCERAYGCLFKEI